MSEVYKKIIDIVSSVKSPLTPLELVIAKEFPHSFLEAFDVVELSNNPPVPEWVKEAAMIWNGGERIRTIKLVRLKTGLGLKEAKDFCDRGFVWPIKKD